MSSETAVNMIETVKKKIEKYSSSEQNDKVKEYLLKLQNTTVTANLLRDTKIDVLVSQLALNNTTSYYSTAKKLLEKWHSKNLLAQSTNSSKVKTITNTNKTTGEKKSTVKRKSVDDDVIHSNTLSESQSSDEYRSGDQDQFSSTKKRKVISLADYASSKKSTTATSSSSSGNSADNKLTDTEIEEIYARFNANGSEFAAQAPVLASDVNKKLLKTDTTLSNRNGFIANGHIPQMSTVDNPKVNHDDFWEEDDDEDDEDDSDEHFEQKPVIQSQPIKNNRTVSNTQSDKKSMTKTSIKTEDHSLIKAIASSIVPSEHSQPSSSRPSQSQPIVPPKKPETFNFLRAKQGRQAIYAGERKFRTTMSSLQDLCVETLKDNVEMACRTHLNRLPYSVVKPIIDAANPEQLDAILNHNPDYVDDSEPLWEQFCTRFFKDAKRDECETFRELYWRQVEEKEEQLKRFTENAKRKKAETVDTTRQTKPLLARPMINHLGTKTTKNARLVGLPPSKPLRNQAKVKKPSMPPLLKKTLKFYNGKS